MTRAKQKLPSLELTSKGSTRSQQEQGFVPASEHVDNDTLGSLCHTVASALSDGQITAPWEQLILTSHLPLFGYLRAWKGKAGMLSYLACGRSV